MSAPRTLSRELEASIPTTPSTKNAAQQAFDKLFQRKASMTEDLAPNAPQSRLVQHARVRDTHNSRFVVAPSQQHLLQARVYEAGVNLSI